MIASILPVYVAVTVTIFAAIGTIAGTILTIINLDQAVERLRRARHQIVAKVRRP